MRRVVAAFVLSLVLAPVQSALGQGTAFSSMVARLSEDGGFFPSDNLVSNETSYLHPLGILRATGVRGGAYIGVGPEQGYSYIAAIEPEMAFLIDIRRDNMLLHLLLKAMFATARNRLEFLCLLYGRPAPADLAMWTEHDLPSLLDWIDATPIDSGHHARNHASLMERATRFGVPLTAEDRETVKRFHDEFAYAGLDVRYSTRFGRLRISFPTNRQLYLETDLEGGLGSYLATEEGWRVVRNLHRQDRIIPVVGNLGGPRAVKAIGTYLKERSQTVSAFYVSNVESYLFRDGLFPDFVENIRSLPVTSNSVLIRSWFGRGAQIPTSIPGHLSTQLVQTFRRFLEITAVPDSVSYWTIIMDTADLAPRAVGPRP